MTQITAYHPDIFSENIFSANRWGSYMNYVTTMNIIAGLILESVFLEMIPAVGKYLLFL